MVEPLLQAVVRKPGAWLAVQDPTKWHYTSRPDAALAMQQHDAFTSILTKHGVQLHYHSSDAGIEGDSDSIFVHDPMLTTPAGAIMMQLGKPLRQAEGRAMKAMVQSLGVPILGELEGNATAEGGDCLWLDSKTLAIGEGYRTNMKGISKIATWLQPHGVTVVPFQLPHFHGADACLHLQSLISYAGPNVAVRHTYMYTHVFFSKMRISE